MGLDELLITLKRNEQKQIDDIWQQAKDQADSRRVQVEETIAGIVREHEARLSSACRNSVREILTESDSAVRNKKLHVYSDLADVLRQKADNMLPSLRYQIDYAPIFARLVGELPDLQWERIVVNPADRDLAAEYFSKDIVQPDVSVSGGLIGICNDGRIVINNTFEKRLARQWTFMLPGLIRDIEKKYANLQPAEKI